MENYSENTAYVLLGTCAFFFLGVAAAWVIAAIQLRFAMKGR